MSVEKESEEHVEGSAVRDEHDGAEAQESAVDHGDGKGDEPAAATVTASAAAADDREPQEVNERVPAATRRSSNAPIWILLLLIVAAIALLLVPNPWQQQARHGVAQLQAWWRPHPVGQALSLQYAPQPQEAARRSPAPAVASTPAVEAAVEVPVLPEHHASVEHHAPVAEPVAEGEAPATAVESASIPHPVEGAAPVPVAVEPDRHLDQQLARLHQQMQQVTSSQQQLAQQQKALAGAALRQQIALLASPATDLQQTVMAWQRVVQMVGLSPQAREQAQAIVGEAMRLLAERKRWQQQLLRISRRLTAGGNGEGERRLALHDIAAIADSAVVHWLDQQFVLYRLPDRSQREQRAMASSLQQMAAAMEQEHWPSAAAWQHARQQVALWLDPAVVEGLPRNFDGMQQQLLRLHQQQTAWIEEVQ